MERFASRYYGSNLDFCRACTEPQLSADCESVNWMTLQCNYRPLYEHAGLRLSDLQLDCRSIIQHDIPELPPSPTWAWPMTSRRVVLDALSNIRHEVVAQSTFVIVCRSICTNGNFPGENTGCAVASKW